MHFWAPRLRGSRSTKTVYPLEHLEGEHGTKGLQRTRLLSKTLAPLASAPFLKALDSLHSFQALPFPLPTDVDNVAHSAHTKTQHDLRCLFRQNLLGRFGRLIIAFHAELQDLRFLQHLLSLVLKLKWLRFSMTMPRQAHLRQKPSVISATLTQGTSLQSIVVCNSAR